MTETSALSVPERLIEAATHLFAERGYDATSVAEIVEFAGVTKGALYHYFQSKEDLLEAIHRKFISAEIADAEEIMSRGQDPVTTLKAMITALIRSIAQYQREVTIFFREMHRLPPKAFDDIEKSRDYYAGLMQSVIERGQNLGVFRTEQSPRLVTLSLFGTCNWIYTWYNPQGPLSPDEIAEQVSRLILHGICESSS
ncbi:transcriptional regulator, TetR family [Sulfobacillus thermosulfidooxidans DSM 9293]|uniref:Transcriptional regulator, TetR family n=1 Tax=Sulfobacillus thermosulfidooxidans (strain DSM 9293 / VKM B-1269 / AT-1) TaxID=929705 RepID=A0A1W1WCK5_SULTA|nr:TetR/AcrR family transcriptional regulator [Sulfobacillus thermosulfidooxidans]SMC03760.1 transcriptional regulator, TetR family [Sulfobacillus thermosulfidooxidans DSM 9293]